MKKYLKLAINKVQLSILNSVQYSEHQMIIFGVMCFIGFPVFYFVWHNFLLQSYDNLSMISMMAFLGLLLMLKEYWPVRLQQFLPIYWYVTLLICLPFFFCFMLLKNEWSVISMMSMLIAILLLVLLVDWLSLTILFLLGSSLAWIAYLLTSPGEHPPVIYLEYVLVYLFAIIIGSIFNYKTTILKNEKLAALSLLSSSIAHELRTPLLGIKSGSMGIKRYLPILYEAYTLAKQHNLPVGTIRTAHYNTLLPALERIESETNSANIIIDMLLMNVGKQAIDRSMFEICSLKECVNQALQRYPFSSLEEAALVTWEIPRQDLYFYGSQLLMIHVLFNLLKNALHFIAKAQRQGEIKIWLTHEQDQGTLCFKDTGDGISSEVFPRIFERFYSTTFVGTGIGLSFCKLVMESFGGNIECESVYGAYTQFRLTLPQVSTAKLAKQKR